MFLNFKTNTNTTQTQKEKETDKIRKPLLFENR